MNTFNEEIKTLELKAPELIEMIVQISIDPSTIDKEKFTQLFCSFIHDTGTTSVDLIVLAGGLGVIGERELKEDCLKLAFYKKALPKAIAILERDNPSEDDILFLGLFISSLGDNSLCYGFHQSYILQSQAHEQWRSIILPKLKEFNQPENLYDLIRK